MSKEEDETLQKKMAKVRDDMTDRFGQRQGGIGIKKCCACDEITGIGSRWTWHWTGFVFHSSCCPGSGL